MPAKAQKLRVGVAGSPPFTIHHNSTDSNNSEGISIEIWEELAASEKLEYELITKYSTAEAINEVIRGELDVVIGPISITSGRLQKVTFTQPFFLANIGLLVAGERPTLWSRFQPFFGLAFISSVGLLIILIFLVANLLWLAERRRNTEQFPKDYFHGVANGMWFALVTLTTVGYGDRAPITKTGRIIAGVWMIVTMVTISSLTAGITTTLTLALSNQTVLEFQNPEDIKNARISVVAGTTGEKWAQHYEARIILSETLDEAIQNLKDDRVDGVVFDVPALQYYLRQNPTENLKISPVSFATEHYGFVLSQNTPFREKFNIKILEMQENGKISEIESKWLY
ncbi:MAG: transporter substrate-binding domain-containing protein [Microcoleaceae cyanobacterium MO_207.B10]|nr:transporter substrate-binding domain-containing protein [Microcoleaceae cyanobacterium MO_207.B10]